MPVADTSREAFHSLPVAGYLQPMEARILRVFERSPGALLSRQQLVEAAGMPLHCVCGRVRSLLDKQRLQVRGERKDPITGKSQALLGLPVPVQADLLEGEAA